MAAIVLSWLQRLCFPHGQLQPIKMTVHARPLVGQSALRRNRMSLPRHVYHLTTSTDERTPFFADFRTARAAIRALTSSDALADSRLIAWVLMPDHLHALLQLGERAALSEVANRMKAATARAVNRHLSRTGAVWQRAFHDHVLRAEEDVRTVARYIVMNPLRAGLVKRIAEYPHWDAVWL